MRFFIFSSHRTLLCRRGSPAEQAPYNSSTISGLGARNIGSATMSGRISALAAIGNRPGKSRSLSARPAAVFGNPRTAAPVTSRSSTNSRCNRSAPSHSIRRTRRTSGSERANRGRATAFRSATESTNPPMAARPGHKSACQTRSALRKIVVSPTSSDTVFAAVPGALWSDSPDRGLYKTTDGGKTWNLVLKGANLSTGASDDRAGSD